MYYTEKWNQERIIGKRESSNKATAMNSHLSIIWGISYVSLNSPTDIIPNKKKLKVGTLTVWCSVSAWEIRSGVIGKGKELETSSPHGGTATLC